MRSTRTVIVAVLAVGLVWLLWSVNQHPHEDAEYKKLRRRQSSQNPNKIVENSVSDVNRLYAELWESGQGRPVPRDLVVNRVEDYFFVGKRGEDVAVEVPFRPGTLPQTPASASPTSDSATSAPLTSAPTLVHAKRGYLGASACAECHHDYFDSFQKTAHHLTSHPAVPGSVHGSFAEGKNELTTAHPDVSFTMLQRDEKYIQRVNFFDWGFEVPFDIVFGSSKMAETFVYWHNTRLYQMNVTYLASEDDWINSPGFIDGDAAYARPIVPGCIECHATYVDHRTANSYTPDSIIFGISCERCHGPGKDHVDYHQANPNLKETKFITVPSKLPRDRELAICSQCHSGASQRKGEHFSFRPGDAITDHYDAPNENSANGVHTTNQLLRLEKSKCFTQSEMTCIDCHNPHQLERGNTKLFSERCIECHQVEACGLHEDLGAKLAENCIDCHMPKRAGDKLRLDTKDRSIFPEMRDHYIRVDSDATKQMLEGTELQAAGQDE